MLPCGVAVGGDVLSPGEFGDPKHELFPIYALTVIVLSILFMAAGLAFESHDRSTAA
jgi:hypothetical protein